jgi:transposase
LKCDHSGNADINAAINLLQRFLRGPYGTSYKPKELGKNVQV